MMIKIGKEKIQELLKAVKDKYESGGKETIREGTRPEFFEPLAKKLNEYSKMLPEDFPKIFTNTSSDYYKIEAGQVRDAYSGKVTSIKHYFYAACNIYLYNNLGKALTDQNADNLSLEDDLDFQDKLEESRRFDSLKLLIAALLILGLFIFIYFIIGKAQE